MNPADIVYSYKAFSRYTVLTRFRVVNLPRRGSVQVRCRGRRCPAARWRRRGSGNLKPFVGRRLPVRTRLTVRLTRRGTIGRVTGFTIRSRKPPKVRTRCLRAGGKPRACRR